jgi:hypothetical protein
LSTLKICTVEGCKRYAHARGRCQRHYDEERRFQAAEAAAAGEGKGPQSRGGRRNKYPPSRTKYLNTNGFRLGEGGNPYGGSAVALEIYRRSNEETLNDSLPWLYEIINDPETSKRDRILAIATRDKIRVSSAQLLYGRSNGMPTTVELLVDDGVVTPLTRLAASSKGDYESLLAERNRINAELRRIDQERAAERAAQEDQLAAARAAKARGEEIHPALAMLIKVKDEDC